MSILDVCPLVTHTIALTSTGGRSPAGSLYSHCTPSQLPLPILPEYLTSIIMPVRMTVKPFLLYRVTECYQQVNMSFCQAFCMSLRTLKSGLR